MKLINKNKLGIELTNYQYALSPSDRTDDVEKVYTRKDLDLAVYEVVGHCIKMLDDQDEVEAIPLNWLKDYEHCTWVHPLNLINHWLEEQKEGDK